MLCIHIMHTHTHAYKHTQGMLDTQTAFLFLHNTHTQSHSIERYTAQTHRIIAYIHNTHRRREGYIHTRHKRTHNMLYIQTRTLSQHVNRSGSQQTRAHTDRILTHTFQNTLGPSWLGGLREGYSGTITSEPYSLTSMPCVCVHQRAVSSP